MLPLDLVRVIAGVCERLGLPYFVTGSLASTFYGEYRATHDVDVVVELPSWQVKDFCAAFPEPDWYVSEDAAMQAARGPGMFNIIHAPTALKLDIIVLGGDRFDECRLSRARKVALPGGGQAIFSAPEDVILKKLAFYREGGSDKHLRDITSMFRVSGDQIDRTYIDMWALRLGVQAEWDLIRQRLGLP